jgi:adenosine deaminase
LINSVREIGVGVTVHTGENTDARHVREAVDAYSPDRIGHGIRTIDDEELMALVKERNIHLEICLTSNWLTRSVESVEKHPFPVFFEAGVSVSINSDDPHLMDIDLVDEYELIRKHYHLTDNDLYRMNKLAVSHSFLDEDIRRFVDITYFNN